MGLVSRRVEDKLILKLVRGYLNSGVLEGRLASPTVMGVPQGGPLSPLLSNLMLDVVDKELERREHRFVRYADDCNIYVRSWRAGERVMARVKGFLARRLKLAVNETKSSVDRFARRSFLEFSFTPGATPKRRVAPKALARFKERVRELTRCVKSVSTDQLIKELSSYLVGWRGYFGYCETPSVLSEMDKWVRRRNLPPRPLMTMDFAIISSLVRPHRPPIQFLSIGSRLCSTLPSDHASRLSPCASLILRRHQTG